MVYLSRNKIYERVEPSKDARKIYIFCEGERTEPNYFRFFQGFVSNLEIIPIPCANGQSAPKKLKDDAKRRFLHNKNKPPEYILDYGLKDMIWFVIDTDRWGNQIDQLKIFCRENNKNYQNWFVAQSNPCFEIWLYYHFYDIKPDQTEVEKFHTFKEFVGNKIPGGGGFDHTRMPIEIATAIKNATANFEQQENGQPDQYSTEVFKLATIIYETVKELIER
ncbi:MAG: RloB family protein [Planctomycetaceae bacterium]|jgi:hypothetical protein|nr:RloB family protein [Planctomycetaceae bacterium]